jgi:hypothetical protein
LNWTTALDLDGNGTFGDVLDPGQDLPTPQALPVESTIGVMRVTAGGSLDIGPGNVIAIIPDGGLQLDIAIADVVTGNPDIKGLGRRTARSTTRAYSRSRSPTPASSSAMALRSTRSADAIITSGAVGFFASGASIALATITKGTTSFTGLEATIGQRRSSA